MRLIVSRHPGAVAWVRQTLPDFQDATVLESATADEVRGADVVGNLPMALAALCGRYRAIEFDGQPPRGNEYTAEDMASAGARLAEYIVTPIPPREESILTKVSEWTSSNSPYAVHVVVRAPKGTTFPAYGDWIDRGESGRVRTIDFVPASSNQAPLAMLWEGLIEAGTGVVVAQAFQGHYALSIGFVRPGAKYRMACGYKCRSERHCRIEGPGRVRELNPEDVAPASLPASGEATFGTSLAEELRRAGLIE